MDGKVITDALSNVKDSYFNKDLITLGYIKGMSIGDKELRFTLRLPAPLMPNHEELAQKCREVLKDVEGLESALLRLSLMQGQKLVFWILMFMGQVFQTW